ncbi:MAG: aconitase X catalytic domain-containing protein [Mogibacterium sp.]|nr:aconitase X catalytic domain-containing protein [Mogibacterium sp.]
MKLNDDQKMMLDGGRGEGARIAMEMIVAIANVYGAEDLIPIKSAHCAGLSLKSHGLAGMRWVEDMAAKGARVVVPTTMNVVGVDRSRDLGLPKDWVEPQMRIEKGYEAMGCFGTSSCVPYYYSFLPKFGEHIAWAESSAVVFTNSVLGARDNREGGPSAWAAGVTGYTPNYGFHLDENRRGGIRFDITCDINGIADYGAMGNFIGKMVGEKIPVLVGLDKFKPTTEELVYMGAAMASAGGVAMFHAVGVTPEAPTVEAAFGGIKDYDTVEFGKKELEQGYHNLTCGKSRDVDFVAIGCPHMSLNQVRQIAEMLDGKHIKDDVTMWVHTNMAIKAMARELGYLQKIEDAGAVLTQDLCVVLSCPEVLGFHTLATQSPKMAFYAPGNNGFDVWYGSEEKCVKAALTGRWED